MKKLVVICQKVDESDDLLGFFVGWLREFAKHYDRIEVITLAVGEHDLPEHVRVHSLGKERGVNKLFWLPQMKWLLLRHTKGASGVFCHMSPVFALVAWPFARLYSTKLVLWYLHRSVTIKLRLALMMVDTLVTADANSLRIKSEKIVSTGHGIDFERFAVPNRQFSADRPLRVLSVGRLSPIKDFGTLIRASAQLKEQGKRIEVRIVGRAVMRDDHIYAQELRHMVEGLGLRDVVEFVGFVPYRDMPAQYAWADIVVGGTPKGGLDKAILEGMASGCVPVTSNEAMRPHLGDDAEVLIYAHGDTDNLYRKLTVLQGDESRMIQIASQVVDQVAHRHSLSQVIMHIVSHT